MFEALHYKHAYFTETNSPHLGETTPIPLNSLSVAVVLVFTKGLRNYQFLSLTLSQRS